MQIIEIKVSRNDGIIWGHVEDKGNFMPTPFGETVEEVKTSLIDLVMDYVNNEGKDDAFWNSIDWSTVKIAIVEENG